MARPDKRKGKRVWVIMDGPRPRTDVVGGADVYTTRGVARWKRDGLVEAGWVGLTIRRATLVLDEPFPKRRGK